MPNSRTLISSRRVSCSVARCRAPRRMPSGSRGSPCRRGCAAGLNPGHQFELGDDRPQPAHPRPVAPGGLLYLALTPCDSLSSARMCFRRVHFPVTDLPWSDRVFSLAPNATPWTRASCYLPLSERRLFWRSPPKPAAAQRRTDRAIIGPTRPRGPASGRL